MARSYPKYIKELALEMLMRGYTPKEISQFILKKYGILVPPNTIAKWKERYLENIESARGSGENGDIFKETAEFLSF